MSDRHPVRSFRRYPVTIVAGVQTSNDTAVGPGSRIGFKDVVIASAGRGIPRVELRGPAADRLARLGATSALVSITHTRDLAMAQALLV